MEYRVFAEDRPHRYRVKAAEYVQYHRDGFLVVPQAVAAEEIAEIREHAMRIFRGDIGFEGLEPPPRGTSEEELVERFSRIHMLHRVDPLSEQYMLHPRVLDVLEALIGPDVLALQTMLFFNPPGKGGQGYHQDSFYIKTYPDTLIGAWIALDAVDEETGCLIVRPGSSAEPIYPHPDTSLGYVHAVGALDDVTPVENASDPDDEINSLAAVAQQYELIHVPVEAGDVVFFHGHLLHRSHENRSSARWRRAFVSHYCNARSWVPWNQGHPHHGDSANHLHILARGMTHLGFAEPKFGTRCAAIDPPVVHRMPSMKPKSWSPVSVRQIPRS